MITEDYASFETAKLLKEKGFDSDVVGCHGGFYSERCYESGYGIKTQSGQEIGIVYDDLTNSDLDYDEYLRPTLQMAIKWLREVHNIHIAVNITYSENHEDFHPDYYACISNTETGESCIKEICALVEDETLTPKGFSTSEEACEAAIKYCLEHLI
jgi:hypothetical protein